MPIAAHADFSVLRPSLRGWKMVEKFGGIDGHKWAQTICAGAAAGIIIGQVLFGAGGLFASNTASVKGFQEQLLSLTAQVSRLSDKIDQGPRADQIIVLDRHLSAQDGRMDSIDTRLRDIENRTAALTARVDLIDQSTHATLGHK
jgi:hypothetical protein